MQEVTFVIVENRWPERVKNLTNYISKNFPQSSIAIKTDLPPEKNLYDRFCSVELSTLFSTSHCIVCQLDGYPINPDQWNESWLKYDYIGSPWPNEWLSYHGYPFDSRVGNGGFSLRSKKLCDAIAKEGFEQMPDDVFVSGKMRGKMEKSGFLYASPEVAIHFGKEHNVPEYNASIKTFGFHSSIINPQWSSF